MSEPYTIVPTPTDPYASYPSVFTALGRAIVSQFRPAMLFALLLPFFVALVGAIVLIWLFWTPLTGWLQGEFLAWQPISQIDNFLIALGIASLKLWLIPVAATLILLPASGLLGLIVAAVMIMPIVLRNLGANDYPDVVRSGENATLLSLWNAIWVGVLFAAGWLLTMPFWLIPPLGVLLHLGWWTFAFTRMLRLDALADHATREERRLLLQRHGPSFWLLGLICALINLLPPAWFLIPVFSSLLFAHYGLEALRQLRNGR